MIYSAKLKTRAEMQRDIPRNELGWWHDVCPGQTLELRDATAEDLARCSLREGTSRNPADYLCENIERGSLVSRKAIAVLTPWPEERLDDEARRAIHRLGAHRFARVLARARNEDALTPRGTRWERRQAHGDGSGRLVWNHWKPCTEEEARRVQGLRTWECRRVEMLERVLPEGEAGRSNSENASRGTPKEAQTPAP